MLSQVMQGAINEQINNELLSSYSYLSMAVWCEHKQFIGCAHWMRLQSEEEHIHAMRLVDFLLARNGKVVLQPITQPEIDFESVVQVFDKALAQEQLVTQQIDGLYELAFNEKAFACLGRARMVYYRASRRRKDGTRDRPQVPHGRGRLGRAARLGPRAEPTRSRSRRCQVRISR